jgi:NADH:ubiquinone oxidoreductase subunit 6 (subunit J)
VLLFLLVLVLSVYSLSPFIFIIFATAASFCLGLLLVANGLTFAGAILIIVNSGAIAMVFLFVCVLSARKTVVSRYTSSLTLSFYFLFSVLGVAGVFGLFYYLLSESNFFNMTYPFVHKATGVLLENVVSNDLSVASHLLFLEKNIFFSNYLFLLGVFLLLSMCVAILVTKRTTQMLAAN